MRTAEVALRIGRGTAPGSPDRSAGWPDRPGAAFSAESSIGAAVAAALTGMPAQAQTALEEEVEEVVVTARRAGTAGRCRARPGHGPGRTACYRPMASSSSTASAGSSRSAAATF